MSDEFPTGSWWSVTKNGGEDDTSRQRARKWVKAIQVAGAIVPLSAARYNDFATGNDNSTPFGVLIFAGDLYLLSGFLNVVLYWYTRPYLLPHHVDSLDDQSFVLRSESPNRQIQPQSVDNDQTSPSLMKCRSAGPAHETSEIALFGHQDGSLRASLGGRDHVHISRDELTGGDTSNIDDV